MRHATMWSMLSLVFVLTRAMLTPFSSGGKLRIALVFPKLDQLTKQVIGNQNQGLLAALIAIDAVNNKSDGVLDDLLPNVTLVYELYDNKKSAALTSKIAFLMDASVSGDTCETEQLAFYGKGAHIVLGTGTSGNSMAMQSVLKYFNAQQGIPQVSGSATSGYLSQKEDYPYFSRIVPTSKPFAVAMVKFAKYIVGWDAGGIITGNDGFSLYGGDILQRSAYEHGLEIKGWETFQLGTQDMTDPIDRIVKTGTRLFFYFGQWNSLSLFFRTMYAALVRRGDIDEGFSIIYPSGYSESLLQSLKKAFQNANELHIFDSMVNGTFSLTMSLHGPLYPTFKSLWNEQVKRNTCYNKYLSECGNCGSHLLDPRTRDPLFHASKGTGGSLETVCTLPDLTTAMDYYTPFMFDTVVKLASAFHSIFKDADSGTVLDGKTYMRTVTSSNFSFDGATGASISLDSNGDRVDHGDYVFKINNVHISGQQRKHFTVVGMMKENSVTGKVDFDRCRGCSLRFNTRDNTRPEPYAFHVSDLVLKQGNTMNVLDLSWSCNAVLPPEKQFEIQWSASLSWLASKYMRTSTLSASLDMPDPLTKVAVYVRIRVVTVPFNIHSVSKWSHESIGWTTADACLVGEYLNTSATLNKWNCNVCPAGASCPAPGMTWLEVKPMFGWWRKHAWTKDAPSPFIRCLYPPACLGGINRGLKGIYVDNAHLNPFLNDRGTLMDPAMIDSNETCNVRKGYANVCRTRGTGDDRCRLCGTCAEGFRRVGTSMVCLKCPPSSTSKGLIVLGAFILVGIVVYLIAQNFKKGGHKSLSGIHKMIVLTFFQQSYMISNMDVPWPQPMVVLFNIQGSVSTLGDFFLDPRCEVSNTSAAENEYYMQIVYTCLLPVVIACVKVLFRVAAFQKKVHYRDRGPELRTPSLHDGSVATVVFLTYLMYPTLCRQAFKLLMCTKVEEHGAQYLTVDLQEQCWQDRHLLFIFLLTIPQIILYVIGIPLIGLRAAKRGRTPQKKMRKRIAYFRYGMLHSAYNDKRWYWAAVIKARKALIVFTTSIVNDVEFEIHWLVIILSVSIMMNLHAQPYKGVEHLSHQEAHALLWFDTTSIFVVFVTAWSALFFTLSASSGTECRAYTCILMLLVMLAINAGYVVHCAYVLRDWLNDQWQKYVVKTTEKIGQTLGCLKSKEAVQYTDEKSKTVVGASPEIVFLQKVFNTYDVDKSGLIDFQELKHMVQGLNISIDAYDLKRIMETFDVDGDGVLTFDEFLGMVDGFLDDRLVGESTNDGATVSSNPFAKELMQRFLESERLYDDQYGFFTKNPLHSSVQTKQKTPKRSIVHDTLDSFRQSSGAENLV
jgi:hypothetical protein